MDTASLLQHLAHAPAPGDFDAYFVVGRYMLEGARSYDAAHVLALQQSLGRGEDFVNLVWYFPHVLPLFCLFALLPYALAWPVWLVLQMGLVFVSADRLWLLAGGPKEKRHWALLLTVAFYPVLALAIWRQASGLLLAGLVGFLLMERKGRDLSAGAWLSLLAIKPQLVYLLWVAIAVWILRTRRFRILLGTGVVITAGLALSLIINIDFTQAYLQHLVHRPPDFLVSPSLGGQLRLLVPSHPYALQFVPAVLGLGWYVATWRRRRQQSLTEQIPALLTAGFVFSVFYWTPDLVLLLVWLVPALAALSLSGRKSLAYVLVVAGLSLLTLVLHEFLHDHRFYALAIVYAALLRMMRLPPPFEARFRSTPDLPLDPRIHAQR